MKTIGFIGLGLIGGSIAKAIRKFHPDYHILAYARHKETLAAALNSGVIDGVLEKEDERYKTCDYIFLCTPVQKNMEYLRLLKGHVCDRCIITDVGSVKTDIHREVTALGMEAQFIGGHPMAGSEKTGLATLVLFDLVGECRKHSINHRFDGSRIGNLLHATLRNDRRGILVFFKDSREHLFTLLRRDLVLSDHLHQFERTRRRERRLVKIGDIGVAVQVGAHVVDDQVRADAGGGQRRENSRQSPSSACAAFTNKPYL